MEFSFFFRIFAENHWCFPRKICKRSFWIIKRLETFCTPTTYKISKNSVWLFLTLHDFLYWGYICRLFVAQIDFDLCSKLCWKIKNKYLNYFSSTACFQRGNRRLLYLDLTFLSSFFIAYCRFHFFVRNLHFKISNNSKILST